MTKKNEHAIRQRLKDDFIHYAPRCLNIRTKAGRVLPFNPNRVQQYIHQSIEEQRTKTGRVRAIILKGRQQGCSTYVEGRYYWRVSHSKGVRAFILTHEQSATDNLFDMVTRYHDHCPAEVRPHTGASNAKELNFDKLDSGYKVGTAGTKAVGRSSTVQLFHGSEVGFWPNAADHAAGILQAVPDEDDTEIILESTANGIGNYYHQQWQDAEAGLSDFIAIFVPWFWQEEYTREVDEGFAPDPDEAKYQDIHKLTRGQMAWRRAKIKTLGSEALFKQEYPATASEAFQASGDGYISAEVVMEARRDKQVERYGPKLVGVDPSAGRTDSADRTAIIRRQGRVAYDLETMTKLGPLGTMQIVARIIAIINQESPDKVFIDRAGLGIGILDRLHELGYSDIVIGVNGGDASGDPQRWNIKKAEMWGKLYDWLKDSPCLIPDSDELHADLTAMQGGWNSNSCLVMETNEHLKARKIRSPDCFVAGTMVLTDRGEIPIETVCVGDMAFTPVGWRSVCQLTESTTDKITTVIFNNGTSLSGKGSHRVLTKGMQWVRLDSLSLNSGIESLTIWRLALWAKMNLFYTRDKSIGFKALVDTFKAGDMMTLRDFYIGGFGSTIMARFQVGRKFITRMVIGVTTRLRTFAWSMVENIKKITCLKICKTKSIENKALSTSGTTHIKHQRGTRQQMESRQQGSEGVRHGLTERSTLQNVQCVELSTGHTSLQGQGSVAVHVNKKRGTRGARMLLALVCAAARSFFTTGTGLGSTVPMSVQTNTDRKQTKTYNITLDEDNVYYANGILVENCGVALALTHAYEVRIDQPKVILTASQEDWLRIQGQGHGGRAVHLD